LLGGLFEAFPDFHVATLKTHYSEEAVIEEYEMTGTHRGVWAGIAPTGRSIKLRLLGLFRFEKDRLMSETVYFDHATLLRQIGAL
jgi:predicted ester cyclase